MKLLVETVIRGEQSILRETIYKEYYDTTGLETCVLAMNTSMKMTGNCKLFQR